MTLKLISKMKINIIKAHGTQNHFIIVYDKKNDPYLKKKETIQKPIIQQLIYCMSPYEGL